MDNIYVNYLLTALILTFAIPGAALAVWQTVLLWYVFISIILHMTMSRQDFKGLYRGIPVVYLIVFVIVYICKFTLF